MASKFILEPLSDIQTGTILFKMQELIHSFWQ